MTKCPKNIMEEKPKHKQPVKDIMEEKTTNRRSRYINTNKREMW
jgi:hypothetical protein